MSFVNYERYIRSPEWDVVRRLALEHARYACQVCGAPDGESELHVHHRSYERLGRELLCDVVVLCSTCHARHHGTKRNDEVREMELYVAALNQVIARLKSNGGVVPLDLIRDRDEAETLTTMLMVRP